MGRIGQGQQDGAATVPSNSHNQPYGHAKTSIQSEKSVQRQPLHRRVCEECTERERRPRARVDAKRSLLHPALVQICPKT